MDNCARNKAHYDVQYRHVRTEEIVSTVRDRESFLADAVATDTSWHGLYHGEWASKLPGSRVLELGSGNGLNALIMASLGADVVAVDISEPTARIIDTANRRLRLRVTSLTGDFNMLPLQPESYDFVVGKAFLHHLSHDLERAYLRKIASVLKLDGEARFFEPAVNSRLLDLLRWAIPVPGRPSALAWKAFRRWKDQDPHPKRDNSTAHYVTVGEDFFSEVDVVLFGTVERFHRLFPPGQLNRRFRRWAHRLEPKLPRGLRRKAARSQLIVYRKPLAFRGLAGRGASRSS